MCDKACIEDSDLLLCKLIIITVYFCQFVTLFHHKSQTDFDQEWFDWDTLLSKVSGSDNISLRTTALIRLTGTVTERGGWTPTTMSEWRWPIDRWLMADSSGLNRHLELACVSRCLSCPARLPNRNRSPPFHFGSVIKSVFLTRRQDTPPPHLDGQKREKSGRS